MSNENSQIIQVFNSLERSVQTELLRTIWRKSDPRLKRFLESFANQFAGMSEFGALELLLKVTVYLDELEGGNHAETRTCHESTG